MENSSFNGCFHQQTQMYPNWRGGFVLVGKLKALFDTGLNGWMGKHLF